MCKLILTKDTIGSAILIGVSPHQPWDSRSSTSQNWCDRAGYDYRLNYFLHHNRWSVNNRRTINAVKREMQSRKQNKKKTAQHTKEQKFLMSIMVQWKWNSVQKIMHTHTHTLTQVVLWLVEHHHPRRPVRQHHRKGGRVWPEPQNSTALAPAERQSP